MKDGSQELDDLTVAAIRSAASLNPGVVHAGDIPKPGGQRFAPALAVLAMAGVFALARFVMDLWEKIQGGLVIDMSKTSPEIYRDPDMPAGYIVVIAKDGSVKIETKDTPKDATQQLIESVIGGALGSAEQIAKAATAAGAQITTAVRA
jgi:hypothetical protein